MLEGAQAHRKETKKRGSDVRHAGTRGEVWQHGLVRSAELKNTKENTSTRCNTRAKRGRVWTDNTVVAR
jgi:hypothetical protein